MTTTVHMFRDSRARHGRNLFSCSSEDWQFLQHAGTAFGWQPRGTTYELAQGSKIVTPALHDYAPGEAADRKQVDRDDAVEWARALKSATRSPQFAAMVEARAATQPAVSVESSTVLIDEFAEYAFGGAFSFAKAEETAPPAG
jgi:hypothetical protein